MKLEISFFEHIEHALKMAPEELLLIDDTVENIEGAQKRGWHIYHYQQDLDALIRFLRENNLFKD